MGWICGICIIIFFPIPVYYLTVNWINSNLSSLAQLWQWWNIRFVYRCKYFWFSWFICPKWLPRSDFIRLTLLLILNSNILSNAGLESKSSSNIHWFYASLPFYSIYALVTRNIWKKWVQISYYVISYKKVFRPAVVPLGGRTTAWPPRYFGWTGLTGKLSC